MTTDLGTGQVASTATVIVVWTVWAIATVLVLLALAGGLASIGGDLVATITVISSSIAALALGTTGAVLVTRLPGNPIGWLLWAGGFILAFASGISSIAGSMFTSNIAGAVWLYWLSNLLWVPAVVMVALFVPLLFPTGHLPSRRWRAVVIVAFVSVAAVVLEAAVGPFTPGSAPYGIDNPLAVGGTVASIAAILSGASTLTGFVCFPLVAASMVLRYRRASGVERAQLRWFAAVAALIGPAFAIGIVTGSATDGIVLVISNLVWLLIFFGLVLLPIAIGLAILRYRLYEIDRLISRTLMYGALTVILALVYLGSILLIQTLLASFTRSNELAVAASTLLVAALFQPIRGRLKRAADRRFNRARYDGDRELAAFAGRLRDEVDLTQVSTEIAATVQRILQPVSASIWLRGPEPGHRSTGEDLS
ncbi:MAG: hypothetical protein ACRDGI_07790 [Candidatus Limnocylindrales bacterium]